MMGIDTIKQINRERAAAAAAEGQVPYVYWNASEVDDHRTFPFPHIGDHRPEGWELVDSHFADASGLGADDEPALSVGQLTRLIKRRIDEAAEEGVTLGWAVIEAGQFQVYVGEFVKTG